jgi:hypothetical protein
MNEVEENSAAVSCDEVAESPTDEQACARLVCQICSGRLIEIRAKLQCERCHTIWETCCEGGRG